MSARADERFDLVSERKLHEQPFILWPRQWRGYPSKPILRWRALRFSESNRRNVPSQSGVYAFVVEPRAPGTLRARYLVYVGKATSLRTRYGDYLRDSKGTGDPRVRIYFMFKMWPDHIRFLYAPLDKASIASAEASLVVAHWPPMNDEILGDLQREGRAFR